MTFKFVELLPVGYGYYELSVNQSSVAGDFAGDSENHGVVHSVENVHL